MLCDLSQGASTDKRNSQHHHLGHADNVGDDHALCERLEHADKGNQDAGDARKKSELCGVGKRKWTVE